MSSDLQKRKEKGKFYVAACAIICKGDEILMTKRSADRDHDAGAWECVSGRFNQDFDTVEEEIMREISEELGDDFNCNLIAPISFYHFYRGDKKTDELVGINYICEYVSGTPVLSSEHTDWQWVPLDKALTMTLHPLLLKDLAHFRKLKGIYLGNKDLFKVNFKKSN